MANQALSTTVGGKSVAYLRYNPPDLSKKWPCLIFLHGIGETGDSTVTTVRKLEQSINGIFTLTASADLPSFTDDITGEDFYFHMLGPQLRTDETGDLWQNSYITEMIRLAKLIPTVDHSRIYLTGLSLGGGGTIAGIGSNTINIHIAAAVAICAGYGNNLTIVTNIARSGVPMWFAHSDNDTTTNPCTTALPCNPPTVNHGGELISDAVVRRINEAKPLVPPKYFKYTTGGHLMWYRVYDITEGDQYPMVNGAVATHTPNFFKWLLRHKRADNIAPYYPT